MKPRVWLGAAAIAAVAASAYWTLRPQSARHGQPLPAGALKGASVLVITIDTLRADRVGAYGSALGATPTLDKLAGEGVRFGRAYAHVPLTLPSHATIMSGLYPTRNGVRDNGTFRLEGKPTLASTLAAAGYRTGAFLGAFVLDARFGLNAGFQRYDDRMIGSGAMLDVVQRRAEQVVAPAIDWILNPAPSSQLPAPGSPWFAWIHFYDPHEPYDPPEPFRTRYASDLYTGEVAYTDAAIGALLDRLKAIGALDHTLVVVMSDHGESLGEHGERTHGLFAYDATLRVPLVFWAGAALRPAVIGGTVRLVDVMPTILDLVSVAAPPGIDGRTLRPYVAGEQPFDDRPSYFEALNANLTRGWAPLKGVVLDRTKLIDLPVPELYDLAADPSEARNLYASQQDRARGLEKRLDELASSTAVTPRAVDADAAQRLRSLGYVVGSAAKPARAYTAADDPKSLVHLDSALDQATAMLVRGDAAAAIDILRGIVKERPDFTVAYDRLAYVLRTMGRPGDAVTLLDEAARAGHADPSLLRTLGSMLRDAGDLRRSASVLEPLARGDASDLQAADALGQTYARMGRFAEAEGLFRRVLAQSPSAATTWSNLGALYLTAGRDADAIEALSRAVAIDPDLAGAHNGLGVAHARGGDVNRAVQEWKEALRIRPDLKDARANLEKVGAR